jgi:hypothetical protein
MTTQKKQFKAALIKYRNTDMKDVVWFWINPASGTPLSPQFKSQEEAEEWYDGVISIHTETYDLLDRIKNGTFYTIKGRIDVGDLISSKKANECPFTMDLEDDILELQILATSQEHAKKRAEEFFEILEWIDNE